MELVVNNGPSDVDHEQFKVDREQLRAVALERLHLSILRERLRTATLSPTIDLTGEELPASVSLSDLLLEYGPILQ